LQKEEEGHWNELITKTIKVTLFNNLVIGPLLLYFNFYMSDFEEGHSFALEDLPNAWTIVWQWYFWIITEDLASTATHRLLHHPILYKKIHKLHHQFRQPIGISAELVHPVEFVFNTMLPFAVPNILLGDRIQFFTFIVIGS